VVVVEQVAVLAATERILEAAMAATDHQEAGAALVVLATAQTAQAVVVEQVAGVTKRHQSATTEQTAHIKHYGLTS
jgi:hypothetical protein